MNGYKIRARPLVGVNGKALGQPGDVLSHVELQAVCGEDFQTSEWWAKNKSNLAVVEIAGGVAASAVHTPAAPAPAAPPPPVVRPPLFDDDDDEDDDEEEEEDDNE